MKIKRNLIQIWFLCAALVPAAAQAQFNYTDNGDGTATITGYTGPGGFVIVPYRIPNTKTGLLVTTIGDGAFWGCSNVTSVSMYSGVTTINVGAFAHCQNLTNVTIPNVRVMIWDEAFAYSGLTSFTIPSQVGSISPYTFGECSNLTSVTIPNSVSVIALEAFWGCTSLTNVTIPSSVTDVDRGVFGDCASLTAITVDTNNLFYSSANGVLFDKSQATLVEYPSGLLNSGYAVPNSVTNIGDEAFSACASLTSVYFRGNAPGLGGSDVFDNDENLTVYCLPGTTDWDTTFGGRPTALWLPKC